MTREEAIKVLSSYDVNGVWADVDGKPYNAEEQAEAFDMAIEALRQETVSRETYDHEFNLRKEFEMKVFELEKKIAEQESKRGKNISTNTPTNTPTDTPTNTPTEAQRKEREMTYTKVEPIKRYCKSKQVMCELANEWGYCKITACANPSSFPKIYTTYRAHCKGGEDE